MSRQQRFSFTGSSGGRLSRLTSSCIVSVAWNPNDSSPEPKRVNFQALWDTGATKSVVTQNVVDACGLVQEGIVNAYHVFGVAKDIPKYYVNFVLPNKVQITDIAVSLGVFVGENVDVLIGMDVIGMGDFAVTNRDGKTKFSFRVPSISDIDFVKEDDAYNLATRRIESRMSQESSSSPSKKKQRRNRSRSRR